MLILLNDLEKMFFRLEEAERLNKNLPLSMNEKEVSMKTFKLHSTPVLVLTLLLVGITMTTCFSPLDYKGGGNITLSISVDKALHSRALVDLSPGNYEPDTFNYELILTGPGGTQQYDFTGTTITVKVNPGKYFITVRGTNGSGDLRALGEQEVIAQGSNNPVNITMKSATEVTSWALLTTACSGASQNHPVTGEPMEEIILLKKGVSPTDWNATGAMIVINRPITLRAEDDVMILREMSGGASNFFRVASGGILCLEGPLTLDGNKDNYPNTLPLIGVQSGGILRMYNGVTLQNNFADIGGGVSLASGAFFVMEGGTIKDNSSYTEGGGVFSNYGAFIMKGGVITNNQSMDGGGVSLYGNYFSMEGGTISGNTAEMGGGGVIIQGTFTISSGNIKDNTAEYGGGVYIIAGTFTMSGGTISDNTANIIYSLAGGGGGVWAGSGTFTMSGGTISGNQVIMGNPSLIYGGGGGVFIEVSSFIKTGSASIFGYQSGDSKSNKVVDNSGNLISNIGHAVYGYSDTTPGYRDDTSGGNDNLSYSYSTGVFDGHWDF